MNYNESGVSIENNDHFILSIMSLCKSTYSNDVISGVGGFCSLYEVPHTDLVIAASTDGIGSKLQLADELDHHQCLEMIGFDLVGMVVNDIITSGADPVFFLDYLALHSIESMKPKLDKIMRGIAAACRLSDVALIGGETAELPGLMVTPNHYDLAGFGVGLAKKNELIGDYLVEVGDAVIGIESSGPHSNGYSLIRKIFKECDWSDDLLRQSIMQPTFLYPRVIKNVKGPWIHSMAHVTGGGIEGNTNRVIPDYLEVQWDLPPIDGIFKIIQETGNVSDEEMRRVFNCGIGFVLIVDNDFKNQIINKINTFGFKSFQIGQVISKEK